MAEKLSAKCVGRKIYLATAFVYDDEMRERVRRHQLNRSQKGYTTIEKCRDITEITNALMSDDTVLLDCLGNLTANEMFDGAESNTDIKIAGKIFDDIRRVNNAVSNLIIISNEIFSSGIRYEKQTEAYTAVLGRLHVDIAAIADTAVECTCGMKIYHKGAAL